LNHPPVPVPLPSHHDVGPDGGSAFSWGTVGGVGASSSTGLLLSLLNTPGVGGELCAKHHCFTRASCNSDEGSSVISGDIGAVGDDRLFFGVDDEDDDAEVLAEEDSEGGSGEATLGGVDRGEERGDANMGIPSLKMGAEVLFGFGSGWSANGWDTSSKLPERLLGGVGVWTGEVTLTWEMMWLVDFWGTGERETPPWIPRRSAKGGRDWLVGGAFLKVGDEGGRGREGGLGSTGEIIGKERSPDSAETLGVTGVGFIVLGATNDLFWEGDVAPGEEGGRLKETR
jgi:hypothetical protein